MKDLSHCWLFAVLVGLAFVPAGCDRPAGGTSVQTQGAQKAGPTHVVRGRIEGLPVQGKPGSQFYVHHEAIADWLRPDGSNGMNSMVMAFPLADGLSLEGLSIGDVVELTVTQFPGSRTPYQTRAIKKLPAETALFFGASERAPEPPSAR